MSQRPAEYDTGQSETLPPLTDAEAVAMLERLYARTLGQRDEARETAQNLAYVLDETLKHITPPEACTLTRSDRPCFCWACDARRSLGTFGWDVSDWKKEMTK